MVLRQAFYELQGDVRFEQRFGVWRVGVAHVLDHQQLLALTRPVIPRLLENNLALPLKSPAQDIAQRQHLHHVMQQLLELFSLPSRVRLDHFPDVFRELFGALPHQLFVFGEAQSIQEVVGFLEGGLRFEQGLEFFRVFELVE